MEDKDFKVISINHFKNFWKYLVILAIPIVPLIAEFTVITAYAQQFLSGFIVESREGMGVKLREGSYTLSTAIAIMIVVLAILATYLIFVMGIFVTNLKTVRVNSKAEFERKDQLIKKLDKRLDTHANDMKKLMSQLYPDYKPFKQNFSFLSGKYYVAPGGDLHVEKEVVVKAVDEPVHFWRFYIEGDDVTKPAEDFADIAFVTRSIDDQTDTVFFPIEDKSRKKIILIWFLPQIEPNTERKIKIIYTWPGLLYGLDVKGKTDFSWNYQCRDLNSRGRFHMTFIFNEHYGNIEALNTGATASTLSLKRESQNARTSWIFDGKDVLLGNTKYELTFRQTT